MRRRASIELGHIVCEELAAGMDRSVAVGRLVGSNASEAEARVKVDTAIEFLCPEQGE